MLKRCQFKINSTLRHWINVESTLFQCCVPAGSSRHGTFFIRKNTGTDLFPITPRKHMLWVPATCYTCDYNKYNDVCFAEKYAKKLSLGNCWMKWKFLQITLLSLLLSLHFWKQSDWAILTPPYICLSCYFLQNHLGKFKQNLLRDSPTW